MAALRRKKQSETELERLMSTQLQLEMQINTLESANLNAETMAAIRKASKALSDIHSGLCVVYARARVPCSRCFPPCTQADACSAF